jgi:hypothetical protein
MAADGMQSAASLLPPQVPTIAGSCYGDREILSEYCGLKRTPQHLFGEWQHGWIWPEYNCHPEMIVGSDGLSRLHKRSRYYVAREDQVEALHAFGYSDVHAIGLPIVYMRKPDVPRIKGSLLVMPSHSLPERDECWSGDEYFQYLSRLTGRVTRLGLCLSGPCIAKGYWKELYPLAREVYTGASEQDKNSLLRLAILFSTYEYVTTNDFGSHVPYAGYFGAKVSVVGPRVQWDKINASASTFYKNCPECADIMRRVKSVDVFKNYAEFCVDPLAANEAVEWARWQLGEENRRSPKEVLELFKWGWSSAMGYRAMILAKGLARRALR